MLRKTYFSSIFLLLMGLLMARNVSAQNITATIGNFNSANCAVGDTVVLPVTTSMAAGITTGAISLAIDYDTTKLQCISSVTSLNSAISAGFLSNCGLFGNQSPNGVYSATTRRQFRAAWFALTPVSVNGLLFNVRFRVLATGNTPINWDVATGGNCEFADEFADVIPNVSFVNGAVTCGSAGPPPCTPPSAIITAAGPTTFCQGGSVVLNANTGTGLTYQWALNGTNISGATNASYTANAAGSYTVTVFNAPTCSTLSSITSVSVTTTPTAGTLSGTQTVCAAGTTAFASTVQGGSWSSSATGVATINASTGLVTGVAAGTATMTYTVPGSGGCANATATRTVTVTPSNTIALGSAAGTNAQTLSLGAAITNITYTTTGAT